MPQGPGDQGPAAGGLGHGGERHPRADEAGGRCVRVPGVGHAECTGQGFVPGGLAGFHQEPQVSTRNLTRTA